MASFTTAEAVKSRVLKAEKGYDSGSFSKWVFIIVDGYGNFYEWSETNVNLNYASSPTNTQILEYINDYLVGNSHSSGGGTYSPGVTQSTSALKKIEYKSNSSVRDGIINNAPDQTEPPL